MKKIALGIAAVMAIWAVPQPAAADALTCPDPIGDYSRQYSVDPALDCVYGDGNLNGSGSDAFLALDDEDSFGGGWTSFSSTDGDNPENLTFECTAYDGDGGCTAGTFSFDGVAGEEYALGIKDGGDPKWAVFLLPDGVYSGTWAITSSGGSLSHLALYDRAGTTEVTESADITEVTESADITETTESAEITPEPATLVLFGSGLAIAGARLRRRSKATA